MLTEIVKINAESAKEFLKNNIDNRVATKDHVKFLSDQMLNGQWKFTGDPIKISKTGRVLDGQHRLMAVVQSNTEHDFLICKDLGNEIFDVLDTGKNRSAGDVLYIEGFENYNGIASLSKMILRYDNGNQKSGILDGTGINREKSIASNQMILEFAQKNDLTPFWAFGSKMYSKNRILTKSEYAFFYYLFSRLDDSQTEIFFDKLVNGINLQDKDPILYLRNKLIENLSANNKMNSRSRLGFVIKGWNLFRQNQSCNYFKFSLADKMPVPV